MSVAQADRNPDTLTCPRCGGVHRRISLRRGQVARCMRCNTRLEAYGAFSASDWLALVITGMLVFVMANVFPVVTLSFQGAHRSATFLDAGAIAWTAGYPAVSLMTLAVGFVIPFVHLCLLLWVFGALSWGRLPLGFEAALRWVDAVKPWSMVPVFLMGILVTIVKLVDLASLQPGVGLFGTIALTIVMTALTRLSAARLRRMAQDMGLSVARAKRPAPPSPRMIQRTWALIAAAIILYIPANLLPIMSIRSMGATSGHTIMGGVIELWGLGSWEVALVVFVASMVVPIGKLVVLITLLIMTQSGSVRHLKRRTSLYGVVEFIGQWSMLDVFVVILLSALAQFGGLLNIEPAIGAVAFGAVVILTMLAAMGFDPRLAWRRAGYRPFATQADAVLKPDECDMSQTSASGGAQ